MTAPFRSAHPAGLMLAIGGLALGGGAALLMPDLTVPAGDVVHGPVLVLGFVGTLVALERAIALRVRWALLAPGCALLGGLVLLAVGPAPLGQVMLATGGVVLLMTHVAHWRRQPSVALLGQAAGAFAWYAATLLWLGGFSVAETVPWLVGFVAFTFAGKRLEFAPAHAQPWFLAVLLGLLTGLLATTLWPASGPYLFGLALLALVAWLVVYDVARHVIRATGLPRYVAVGLLGGYGWLAFAGLLWAGAGPVAEGPRYDVTLQAVFIGFALSMVVAHVPVTLPLLLSRPLPYHPTLYLPLVLLHLTLLIRLGAHLLDLATVVRWSGVGAIVTVVAFLACVVTLAARAPVLPAMPAAPVGAAPSGVPR